MRRWSNQRNTVRRRAKCLYFLQFPNNKIKMQFLKICFKGCNGISSLVYATNQCKRRKTKSTYLSVNLTGEGFQSI